jgi:hypothetical protein
MGQTEPRALLTMPRTSFVYSESVSGSSGGSSEADKGGPSRKRRRGLEAQGEGQGQRSHTVGGWVGGAGQQLGSVSECGYKRRG